MDKRKLIGFTALCTCVGTLMFSSCTEDIELTDAEPSIGLDLGLALPGGTIKTTLGDFLGNTGLAMLKPDENGLYRLTYDTIIEQSFEVPPLQEDFISKQQEFRLVDHYESTLRPSILSYYRDLLPAVSFPDDISFTQLQQLVKDHLGLDLVIPAGQYPFTYDLTLSLAGTDLDRYKDLDSIHLDRMIFTSLFRQEHFSLSHNEMTDFYITFDDAFRFADGIQKRPILVTPDLFDQGLRIIYQDLMVRMPRNPQGTLDDVHLSVSFVLNLQEPKTLQEETMLLYSFAGNRMTFDIIYGAYKPEDPIATADEIQIADMLPIDLTDMKLPFAEPAITLGFYTGTIGMPTDLLIDEIYTQDSKGVKKQATFNGQPTARKSLPYITDPESTDVDTAWINLSNDPAQGNLDQLFTITPDRLGYAFRLEIDEEQIEENSQQGIASFMMSDIRLGIKMHMELPMVFDPGVSLAYSDTIPVELGNTSDDDGEASGIDTLTIKQVVLNMAVTNEIPFNIDAVLNFMDAGNNIIPVGKEQAIAFTIAGSDGKTPKQSDIELLLTDEDAAKLNQVKQVKYDFTLGDNTVKATLKSTSGLQIRFSLGTKIGATINLGENENTADK